MNNQECFVFIILSHAKQTILFKILLYNPSWPKPALEFENAHSCLGSIFNISYSLFYKCKCTFGGEECFLETCTSQTEKDKKHFWEVRNALWHEHAASINLLLEFDFSVHFTRSSGCPDHENISFLFYLISSFSFSSKSSELSWDTLDIILKHLLTVSP